jgi:hypothetical protein
VRSGDPHTTSSIALASALAQGSGIRISAGAAVFGAAMGCWLGAMLGLIVNAFAMIIEEPRPHW